MLTLPPEEMRRLGYEVVDRIVDHFGAVAEKPPLTADAAPSTTELGGRVVLRLCTINPRTTFADIEATIERMELVSGSCA